jgi:hypothetical protein
MRYALIAVAIRSVLSRVREGYLGCRHGRSIENKAVNAIHPALVAAVTFSNDRRSSQFLQ